MRAQRLGSGTPIRRRPWARRSRRHGHEPGERAAAAHAHRSAATSLGSCERRRCRFHAAEGVHEHRLLDSGQQAATSLAGAVERFSCSSRRGGSPGR